MVGLIFGIILLIIGVVTGVVFTKYKREDIKRGDITFDYPLRKFSIIPVIVGIILCIMLTFFGCITSVATGHTGIVTTFGRVENYTFDAGVHFKSPWNSVVEMDNRVQKATVTLPCFSSDIQEVNTVYTINYQISKTNAQDLYRTVGTAYLETVIKPATLESVKTIMAHYTAEDLIGKRDTLASEIEIFLSEQLIKYNIEVVSTAIEDMDFTDAFTDAVEAKQVAAQNKLKAEIVQEQQKKQAEADAVVAKTKAEAEAEVAKIQAQADLEVQKINADAAEYTGRKEAAKNEAISNSLTPELIDYLRILQWDGKLPETMLGDSTNILLSH